MPVAKEGKGNRDLLEPGASVVLRDGLGVPPVLAKGVEVLQGHGGVHPGRQGAEAEQEGSQQQEQQHHGFSHPGMELTAGAVEGREELTHLRQQVQSGSGRCVPLLSPSSWTPHLTARRLCLLLAQLLV